MAKAKNPPPSPSPESAEGAETPILDTTQGEIALFKALTRFRPVGPNKHFEMVQLIPALNQSLLRNVEPQYNPREVSPEDVWAKLEKLYDLEKLDELNSPDSSPPMTEFTLPYSPSFNEQMDKRRRHSAASLSPPSDSPRYPLRGSGLIGGSESSGSALSEPEDEDEEAAPEEDGEGEDDGEQEAEDEEEDEEEDEDEEKEKKVKKAPPKKQPPKKRRKR